VPEINNLLFKRLDQQQKAFAIHPLLLLAYTNTARHKKEAPGKVVII